MDKTAHNPFAIGEWLVSPPEGTLTRGSDVERLEPKAMEVLVYLAKHHGKVVTREELEREVWRGALIGYDAVTSVIIKLRKALQDDAKRPQFINTIPKRGYQLIAPVSYLDKNTSDQELSNSNNGTHEPTLQAGNEALGKIITNTKKTWLVIALPASLVTGVLWLIISMYSSHTKQPTTKATTDIPARSSIAVLPFENLGGDKKDELLANGITEDLITDLSRLPNILVIGSSTSSHYKDSRLHPADIGKELNVKFLLKGSIRRLDKTLRVNVELVDINTNFNMWAQRYDGNVSEIFSVQDKVTQRIVESLAIKMTEKEKQRLSHKSTENLAAYDLFQEGQRLFKFRTKNANQDAMTMYRRAIELDPGYGRAYGGLAVALASTTQPSWTDSPRENLDRALELAKKAVELDGMTPQTHFALGFVYLLRKEYKNAERAASRSIEIAPSYADGVSLLSLINACCGDPDKVVGLSDKAIQLNPYFTAEYLIPYGIAHYRKGQYAKAVSYLENSFDRNMNNIWVGLFLTASYVGSDRLGDAQWIVTQLLINEPTRNLSEIEKSLPIASDELKRKLFQDLRHAGMPE